MSDYWIDQDSGWNTVRLGDIVIPGLCIVTTSRGRDIDFQKAPGRDGGLSVDKGQNAGKVQIRVILYKREHWDAWKLVLPKIEPRDGKPTGPLGIVHPDPNTRGIMVVQVKDIASAPPTAKGGKVYDIECEQWFSKSKSTQKRDPSYSSASFYTAKGTDKTVDGAGQLKPFGLDVIEASLGTGPAYRQGTTVIENPRDGTLKPSSST